MSSQAIPPERIDQLTDDIGERLRAQLQTIEIPAPVEIERCPQALLGAMGAISESTGQASALRALLNGAADLGARAAVFVLRDDFVQLWEGVGFEADLDEAQIPRSQPAVEGSIEGASVDCASEGETPIPDFGQGEREDAQFEPIRVQEKVVGLLYADTSDTEAVRDVRAIRALAALCGLAVERLALLKTLSGQSQAPAEHTGPVADELPVEPEPSTPAPTVEEPSAAEAVAPPAVLPVPPMESPVPDESPIAPELESAEKGSPEAEDARRFARLLMEEICLYNGDKIEAGRVSKDILSRLGDEVEQARKMYSQRVAPEVAAEGDFFEEAMVKVLAAGDAEALGSQIAR